MSSRGLMSSLRWVIAAAGAGALVWLIAGGLPGRSGSVDTPAIARGPATPPPADICPAGMEPAKLDYTLKNIDGAPVSLADYKGKVLLIDFWATWCGPCKVEIPGFIDLQEKYGKQGLQIIGVSVDDTPDKLKPYVADMKMNYPVLQGLGHDDLLDEYGTMISIPVSVVISRDGKICSRHMGLTETETFEAKIKALL